MRLPFVGQRSEVNWYYEVLFEEGEATILEQVYYGLNGRGHQMLCRCDTAAALQHLEQQLAAWTTRSISINSEYANFQQQHCLNEQLAQPLSGPVPKVNDLLNAKAADPIPLLEGATLSGQWLKAEDGHWVLDLAGDLPPGYTFHSFAEQQALYYIKAEETLLYPPDYAPDWKRQLVSGGRFGKNIINSADQNYNQYNLFTPFEHISQGRHWNMLFRWQDSIASQCTPQSASGVLYLQALNGETEERNDSLRWLSPDQNWEVSYNGKGINFKNLDDPNSGTYTVGAGLSWGQASVVDSDGNVIVSYQSGLPGPSASLPTHEGKKYTIKAKLQQLELVEIPFEGDFPIYAEHSHQTQWATPAFQYFGRRLNGIKAAYLLDLPLDTHLRDFRITRAVDDQGKNLLAAQFLPPPKVEMKHDSYYERANRYKLDLGPYDWLSTDACELILEGGYTLQTENGARREMTWADTLSLAKGAVPMPQNQKKQAPPSDAVLAEYVQVGALESGPGRHGIRAVVPFQVPDQSGRYFGIDAAKSGILELYDDRGHDLKAAHTERFDERLWLVKTSIIRYSTNEDINQQNLLLDDWFYPNETKLPEFKLRAYSVAGEGARAVFGKARITYYTYDPATPQRVTQVRNIKGQQTITLSSPDDGLFFPFERSSFEEDARDGRSFTKYRYQPPYADPGFYLASVTVKDLAGEVVSLTRPEASNPGYFEPHNLMLPEGEGGRYFIELVCYPLEEHTIEVPFRVGIN